MDNIIEINGKLYKRLLHHGYYTLRPIIDGVVSSSNEIAEHRVVYEASYNVKLADNVCVHHLNRNKTDNRLENLIALSISDHNKLHAFEERTYDMKTLIDLDDNTRLRNAIQGDGRKKDIQEAYKKLVAYDSKIYYRIISNGRSYLFPVVDGLVDYTTRIPEHRLAYEIAHGVTLPSNAIIKHINGNALDNSPENLLLANYTNGNRSNSSVKHIEQKQATISIGKPSKDILSELIEKYSNVKIAKMYGVTSSTVASWRKDYGLPSSNEQHGWNRGNKPTVNKILEQNGELISE